MTGLPRAAACRTPALHRRAARHRSAARRLAARGVDVRDDEPRDGGERRRVHRDPGFHRRRPYRRRRVLPDLGLRDPVQHPARPRAPVGSFVIKRVLRIYPAYWLSVPLAAFVVFWIWGTPFTAREVLVNFTLMQDRLRRAARRRRLLDTARRARVLRTLRRAAADAEASSTRAASRSSRLRSGSHSSSSRRKYWLGRQFITTSAPYWFLNLSVMLCGALFRSRWDTTAMKPTPSPMRCSRDGRLLRRRCCRSRR